MAAEHELHDGYFCEVEQTHYPVSHFGIGPGGQVIHLKVRPSWNNPGQGHTRAGQDVWFEGKEGDGQTEWELLKIWPRP